MNALLSVGRLDVHFRNRGISGEGSGISRLWCFATALAFATFVPVKHACAHDLISLWESRSATSTDTFYTTYYNDHLSSIATDGFVDRGVVAWLPCSKDVVAGPNGEEPFRGTAAFPDVPVGDSVVPSRYSHGYRARMNFACDQPAGTKPLYGMYKGAPESDHIYTTSVDELNALKHSGYTFRRVEGYVFTSQVKDSVPLYRLEKKSATQSHDTEHRYTSSRSAKKSLENSGWSYQGIVGYVFDSFRNEFLRATGYTGTFNGHEILPDSSALVRIRDVLPPIKELVVGGNSTTHQYGAFASNSTRRPKGAVWQNISFDFFTGNIFDKGSTLDHIPIFLHYASAASVNQLSALPPYDGIAMVISREGLNGLHCGAPSDGGQVYIEIGQAMAMSCASNLSEPMRSNTWYSISYSLSDSADVRLEIVERSTSKPIKFIDGASIFLRSFLDRYSCPLNPVFGQLDENREFCDNPYSVHGFPVRNTGYMMFPLFFGEPPSMSARISGVSLSWLDRGLKKIN